LPVVGVLTQLGSVWKLHKFEAAMPERLFNGFTSISATRFGKKLSGKENKFCCKTNITRIFLLRNYKDHFFVMESFQKYG
jgi:hypothetical protein